jgi:diguanylate cyclase (GGDEF)-like protein
LSLWLFGIFTYQLNQLRLARKQRSADSELIFTLNNDNKYLQEETSKFRRLSTVDLLTQTYNRFGIDQVVNALIAAKTHMSMPGEIPLFCLILFDIDYFKKVNDSYGHDVGDIVLQKISNNIQEELRPFDYLGRWGGEEFLIILPRTEMYVGFDLAEVLRKKLASTPIEVNSVNLQLTASFGVASCWDGDYASAFKRVDDALYQAKHSGRNRTVIAEDRAEAGSS